MNPRLKKRKQETRGKKKCKDNVLKRKGKKKNETANLKAKLRGKRKRAGIEQTLIRAESDITTKR